MININKVDVLIWQCIQNWFIVSDWEAMYDYKNEEFNFDIGKFIVKTTFIMNEK